ncbi:MAG: DUF4386 domain-containing protein [Bacteroidetes bacterium]|nr:DUF4386 domain-containing protein [Bacteroidota bacterium]
MDQNSSNNKIQKARIIGSFFLLAFLLYGIGRNIFESEILAEKYTGALLIIGNSIIVLLIGIFLRKSLIKFNVFVGNFYLFSRIFEAIALASIVLNIFPELSISLDTGYFLGMIVLGIGSIPMCFIFLKHRVIPKWLAIWGIIGYAVFAFGFLMELFGNKWSMYLLGLGGLWEIFFSIWLIIKGGKIKTK